MQYIKSLTPYAPAMVCTTPLHSSEFKTLKEETFSVFESTAKHSAKSRVKKMLIIDKDETDKWKSLGLLNDIELHFADSIHSIIRSGLYQNFTLFGLPQSSPYISCKDFEKLLLKRSVGPVVIFEFPKLRNLDVSEFKMLISEIEHQTRINHSINRIERDNYFVKNTFKNSALSDIEIRRELEVFLKSQSRNSNLSPEQTLAKGINLIRSSQ